MVDNSDLTNSPEEENMVVRVKRVNMDYINTVTESTLGNILATVKYSLHITDQYDTREEITGSGDDQLSGKETQMSKNHLDSKPRHHNRKPPKQTSHADVTSNHTTPVMTPVMRKLSALPFVYVIGAKTCGAEELGRLLNCHPQIVTTQSTRYFVDETIFRHTGDKGYRNNLPKLPSTVKLIEVGEDLFSTPAAVYRIKKTNPLAKLIVILRDPMERLMADFIKVHGEGSGDQYNETFVITDDDNKDNAVNEKNDIISHSMYDVHLRNWVSKFNASHILLIDYFLMVTQPLAIMKSVETFLRLQPFYHKLRFTQINNTTLCTKVGKSNKASPVCLSQDHPDNILPDEVEETLRTFFTRHIKSFWKIVSTNNVPTSKLVSLATP